MNHIELAFTRSALPLELSVGKPNMSAGNWTSFKPKSMINAFQKTNSKSNEFPRKLRAQ